MKESSQLSEIFIQHGPEDVSASPELEEALVNMWSRARAAWPDVDLEPDIYFAHVAERIPEGIDAVKRLGELRAGDLYLACACYQRDPVAVARFAARYDRVVDDALVAVRTSGTGARSDDVKQALLERLLYPYEGYEPAVARYSGQGDLRAYVQLAAVRQGMRAIRKTRRHARLRTGPLELTSNEDDPELALMKRKYGETFKQIFQETVEGLTDRERNLLRHYYINRLTTREIGVIYGAHNSTVTRWLAQVRVTVLERTRDNLAERLQIPTEDFDSVMRLVKTNLDLSITRILRDE